MILAVVIANGVIGFIQESRAETTTMAIRSMLAPRASVIRSGKRLSVDAATIVRGDIVLLEQGDEVPGVELLSEEAYTDLMWFWNQR